MVHMYNSIQITVPIFECLVQIENWNLSLFLNLSIFDLLCDYFKNMCLNQICNHDCNLVEYYRRFLPSLLASEKIVGTNQFSSIEFKIYYENFFHPSFFA